MTTMKHMGLWPHGWPLEDLIDVGWQYVFFYAETYEKFERYGYLHAISHMTRYIYAERHRRVHDLWAGKTVGESAERTEYSEPILIPSPAVVLQERERWECTGCGYLAEEQSGVCPKCGQKTWRPVQRREGVPVSPDPEPDGEVTAWAQRVLTCLSRDDRALLLNCLWRGRTCKSLAATRGVTRQAMDNRYHQALDRARQVAEAVGTGVADG